MSTNEPERKYSVYIALIVAGAVSIYDLTTNNNMDASKEFALVLIAFAGLRQAAKSFLNSGYPSQYLIKHREILVGQIHAPSGVEPLVGSGGGG